MWAVSRKLHHPATATPSAYTSQRLAKHHNVFDNNKIDSSSPSSLSQSERGVLHKNVHGNSIRLYAHLRVPDSYDRYSMEDNDDHKREPQEQPCFISTNSVTFAMLRAQADGISFEMLSDFLSRISDDLRELNLMTFEEDVKKMSLEGSEEVLRLLQDPVLQAHFKNFALSVKKADLEEAWPVLCKYGQLVEKDREEEVEDDDDSEPKKKKKEDLAGLQVIEELLAGKISSSACADDAVSKDANEGGAEGNSLMVVSASKKKLFENASSGLHKVSGQHLMLFLVFLMVIYRGLSMFLQQRRVKTLTSRPSLESLLTEKQ